MPRIKQKNTVPDHGAGKRLDRAAAELFPDFSRSRIQAWIRSGELTVDGDPGRPSQKTMGGESLQIDALLPEDDKVRAQPLPLDILYQDEHLIVLNKPPGLVVHPGAGNPDGTLQNALLHFDRELAVLPRAGIIHRLDKDTSGIMVVARSLAAHKQLVDQLQARDIQRQYLALAMGEIVAGGTVDAAIGRHPVERKKMAVIAGGKTARTHYRVIKKFTGLTLLQVNLETGRTHQIRVHMAHIGHPLVGDPLYGGRRRLPKGLNEMQRHAIQGFKRQSLHASRLQFRHPVSAELMDFEAPLEQGFKALLDALQAVHAD